LPRCTLLVQYRLGNPLEAGTTSDMNRTVLLPALLLLAACAATPRVPEGIVVPRVLHRVEPDYPQSLRDQGVQGEVRIAGTVPKEGGHLRDIRVVGGSEDMRLQRSAVAAASQRTFSPGMQNGEAVDVEFTVTISFRVNG
jgi:TonB family protein